MLFVAHRKSPTEVLAAHMEKNPTWPFERQPDGTLTYHVRYSLFKFSIVATILTLVLMLVFVLIEIVTSEYFLWLLAVLIVSIFGVYNYRETRHYMLDPRIKRYTFLLGERVIVDGAFHNVYVRLRSSVIHGQTEFYLILNGYKIDQVFISSPDADLNEMRRLGQRLASNLGINYFDKANVSPHHVVMHTRENQE